MAFESKLTDLAQVKAELWRIEGRSHWSIAIYDERHTLLAGTHRLPAAEQPDRVRSGLRRVPLHLPSGQQGSLVLSVPPPTGPPPGPWFLIGLVLVVVGITGWWAARSLAQPLAALSQAARALGAGQLATRAPLDRRDEFGDVGRAFNDMAERITKLLRAEKELIANISHELRTPLARIQVALDLAAEGDAESARESLHEITEDLAELERIVDDVLTAARLSLSEGITAGSAVPPIRVTEVDLGGLVERASSRFRAVHPSRSLELQLGSVLPNVRVDPVLFRRAIDNLLDNAAKHSEGPSALITLVAFRNGSSVIFEVRDLGIGIAPEDLERVFEPFFRADRSRARATGGYGLGLALARRIVEAHAGSLKLSPRPGGGTIARIQLPIAQ